MNNTQKVGQFIYTASPWGRSDPGWMVFATSAGMDVSLADSLKKYYRYIIPDGMSPDPSSDELSTYPVQYIVAKVRDGDFVIISQTTFTGRRWYDPRPGDWIAHVFLIPAEIYKAAIGREKRNPFAWYRSGTFKECYLKGWKEKAEAIARKDIPYEAPPTLDTLESITEVESNLDYEFTSLLYDIEDTAFPKIGKILWSIFNKRNGTGQAFAFDATNPASAKTMALLLELLPDEVRVEAEFASYLHREVVTDIHADSRFLFYGTVREGEDSDLDTGLYGELPQDGLNFRCRDDVELFKQMLDSVSSTLNESDLNSFVKCWEVATGLDTSVNGMRAASMFCVDGSGKRFPELHTLLLDKIAAKLSEDVNTNDVEWLNRFAVARFEIGADTDDYALDQFCEACAMDKEVFSIACQCLRNDALALRKLLKALEHAASSKEFKENLAERFFETDMIAAEDVKAMAGELPFINLVLKYHEIVKRGAENSSDPQGDIKVVEELQRKFGTDIPDMDNVLSMLKYKRDLLKITSIEDIPKFLKPPFSEAVSSRMKDDLVSRIEPPSPQKKVQMARILDELGLSGDDYIVTAWIKDLMCSKNNLDQVNGELKRVKMRNAKLNNRMSIFGVVVIAILCLLIGWTGHWVFAGNRHVRKDQVDIGLKMETPSVPDTPQTNLMISTSDVLAPVQTEEVHALAGQNETLPVAKATAAQPPSSNREEDTQELQPAPKKRPTVSNKQKKQGSTGTISRTPPQANANNVPQISSDSTGVKAK